MISVLIPVKNRAGLFRRSLEAYVNQTHKDFEIIVVDHLSTDGLEPLLREFSDRLRIRGFTFDAFSGTIPAIAYGGMTNPCLAWNYAARQAHGETLVLTSPETVPHSSALERLATVGTNEFRYLAVENAEIAPNGWGWSDDWITATEFCGLNKHPEEFPHVFFYASMRKETYESLRGMEELFSLGIGYDDTEFGRRVKAAGVKITLSPGHCAIHQRHEKTLDGDIQDRGRGLQIGKATFDGLDAGRKTANVGRDWGKAKAKEMNLSVLPPAVVTPHRNVILHVHNVARFGGTGNFVIDFARCFPEFHHVALAVRDNDGDPAWMRWAGGSVRVLHNSTLTSEILSSVNPAIVVLHNTVAENIEGEWPFSVLDGRFVISYHHNPTRPLIPAALDVFVSEFVKKKYAGCLDRCEKWIVCPPCIDTDKFTASTGTGTTGAGKAPKCPADLLDSVGPPKGTTGDTMPAYLARFSTAIIWPEKAETWCRTLTECLAAGLRCFVHRSGGLVEQKTPYWYPAFFDDESDLRELLDTHGPTGPGCARTDAGFPRLRRDLYPHLCRALIGGG